MTNDDRKAISTAARHLMRSVPSGSLATVMRESAGAPYVSLVSVATDHDGSPILLLSDLADHTKNLKQDDRVSLLLVGDNGDEDPLAGERLSLEGHLVASAEPSLRARYLARHPGAALYADFGDFAFYRMAVTRAHLVAGFGRISWIDARHLLVDPKAELAAAEAGIIEHMNSDHADAVELYATRLLGRGQGAWRITGVDPEGADLRLGRQVGRLSFGCTVENGTDVRKQLIRLVNEARSA